MTMAFGATCVLGAEEGEDFRKHINDVLYETFFGKGLMEESMDGYRERRKFDDEIYKILGGES